MYSITIVKEDFLAMKKLYGAYDKTLIKYFDRVNREMLSLRKTCDKQTIIKVVCLVILCTFAIEIALHI